MQIVLKRTADLIPYERNPRDNDGAVDAVAASIREFGFKVPIIVDKNGVIVAGHTRLKAAKKLGLEEVPTIVADDLSPEQIKAFRLADNKTAELAGWDFKLLDEELAEIATIDMTAFGFEEEPESAEDVVEDDYDGDDESIEQRAEFGDMFELGGHILICGDATDLETQKCLVGGGAPVMVFTDPPYGVSIGDKNADLQTIQRSDRITENIMNDTLAEGELYGMLVKAFSNLRQVCSDECSYYVSAPQGGGLRMMMTMMKDAGLEVKHNLIWVKNVATFSMGRLDYSYRHEPIFYTWTKKHNFYGGYETSVIDDTADIDKMSKAELKEALRARMQKEPDSVIYCDKPMANRLHPTMKPIKLIARFIVNSSRKGDVVADIFGGSGSTMIACEQLGRRCRMLELDPHYCDVIVDRWEKFTGQKARKVEG